MPTDRSKSVEAIIARLHAAKKHEERRRIKAGEQAAVATGGAVPASDLDPEPQAHSQSQSQSTQVSNPNYEL